MSKLLKIKNYGKCKQSSFPSCLDRRGSPEWLARWIRMTILSLKKPLCVLALKSWQKFTTIVCCLLAIHMGYLPADEVTLNALLNYYYISYLLNFNLYYWTDEHPYPKLNGLWTLTVVVTFRLVMLCLQ